MIFRELFRAVMDDPALLLETISSLKEDWFEDVFDRTLVREVVAFHAKYRKVPTMDEMSMVFRQHQATQSPTFEEFASLKVGEVGTPFLKAEILKSLRAKGLEKIIIQQARALGVNRNSIDYEKLFAEVRHLVLSTQENKLGLAAFKDVDMILDRIQHAGTYNRIPLNEWRLFDALLGGIGRQEIMLYMAPSGAGKTTFLVNLAVLAMLGMEKNVLCITTELTDTVFTSRLYCRMLQMTRDDFKHTSKDELSKRINKFMKLTRSKIHVIYKKPNQATPLDIQAAIEQFENIYGEQVDVVILDYLDKMKIPRGDMYRLALQDMTEELRSIALEKNLAMLTATQSNRESMKKGDTTGYHTSEGIGKHQSSDVVITQQQTEEERIAGVFKLRFDKVREISIPQSQQLFMKIDPTSFVMKEDVQRTLAVWKDYGFKNFKYGSTGES